MNPKKWILIDESAKDMLARSITVQPFLLCPPLNRVPLRAGNVMEIIGSSPTAKTDILIQATTSCILPQVWNGIYYGGLERVAMYIDLDCTFDIRRLAHSLKRLIMSPHEILNGNSSKCNNQTQNVVSWDEDLFSRCMQSIGAFHWMDRSPMPFGEPSTRKMPSVQCIFETVVEEIQKLILQHPTLVLVTRATILGHSAAEDASREMVEQSGLKGGRDVSKTPYREYMPCVWQSFVTHRAYLWTSGGFLSTRWLVPSLDVVDQVLLSSMVPSLNL